MLKDYKVDSPTWQEIIVAFFVGLARLLAVGMLVAITIGIVFGPIILADKLHSNYYLWSYAPLFFVICVLIGSE